MGKQVRKVITAFDRHGIVFALLVIFFAVFYVITNVSPLAGDDWSYAVLSRDAHPLVLMFRQYFSWSGRLLSELWGYTIPRNKWLYDLLNPMIFTAVFALLLKTARTARHPVCSALCVFFLIFSVNDYVRMQTYTWCMGETYIIPLLLFLIYLYFMSRLLLDHEELSRRQRLAMTVLNFCIPLYMENAAGMLVGGNLIIAFYCWKQRPQELKGSLVNLAVSAAATCIIGLSPGSHARLVTSQAWFSSMSLLEKIRYNWQNFLKFTFMNNSYLILFLSAAFLALLWVRRKEYRFAKWHLPLLSLPFCYGILQSQSERLAWSMHMSWADILCSFDHAGCTRLNTLAYGLWVLAALWALWSLLPEGRRQLAVFAFVCAGGANLVMLISPIFDARSSVYTIYLLLLVLLLVLEEIPLSDRRLSAVAAVVLCLLSQRVLMKYRNIYYKVYRANNERMFQISGYSETPSVKEVWLVRMPKMSLHSADVEDGDDFHTLYFKKYYNLAPDTVLHFYYRDDDYNYYGEPIH